MAEVDTYSTTDACRLTGLTYRQLDWWIRQGHICPEQRDPGSGHHRRFTRDDIMAIMYVADRVHHANRILERHLSGELWEDALNATV